MKITEKTFHETCRRGWCGDMRRGAAMGRGSYVPHSPVGKAHLIRVRLSSGGYAARGGAYFGHGAPLYWLYQAWGYDPDDAWQVWDDSNEDESFYARSLEPVESVSL